MSSLPTHAQINIYMYISVCVYIYIYIYRHTILKYSTKTVKFEITQIVCECEFVSWWLLDEKEQR